MIHLGKYSTYGTICSILTSRYKTQWAGISLKRKAITSRTVSGIGHSVMISISRKISCCTPTFNWILYITVNHSYKYPSLELMCSGKQLGFPCKTRCAYKSDGTQTQSTSSIVLPSTWYNAAKWLSKLSQNGTNGASQIYWMGRYSMLVHPVCQQQHKSFNGTPIQE